MFHNLRYLFRHHLLNLYKWRQSVVPKNLLQPQPMSSSSIKIRLEIQLFTWRHRLVKLKLFSPKVPSQPKPGGRETTRIFLEDWFVKCIFHRNDVCTRSGEQDIVASDTPNRRVSEVLLFMQTNHTFIHEINLLLRLTYLLSCFSVPYLVFFKLPSQLLHIAPTYIRYICAPCDYFSRRVFPRSTAFVRFHRAFCGRPLHRSIPSVYGMKNVI